MGETEENIEQETELNDYVDYSYAEMAAQKKTTEFTILANETNSLHSYENYNGTVDEHITEGVPVHFEKWEQDLIENEEASDGIEGHNNEIEGRNEEINQQSIDSDRYIYGRGKYRKKIAYAEEAQILKTPLKSSPGSLQIEWTARSETPI